MFKYEGAKCPVCTAYLMEEDDIVVCPECGAPHHRDCWSYNKKCGCTNLHEQHKSWSDVYGIKQEQEPTKFDLPSPNTENNNDKKEKTPDCIVCPKCSSVNPPTSLFCNKCSTPLNSSANPKPIIKTINMNPLGGVASTEDFEGVSALELSKVVGSNSMYYIPRFKYLRDHPKKPFPNLAALFMTLPWLLFRRLIPQAIILFIINFISYLPSMIDLFFSPESSSIFAQTSVFSDETFYTLSIITSIILWLSQLIFCFFGNKMYYKRCIKIAKKIKSQTSDPIEFEKLAKAKGGTKFFNVYALFIILLVSYLALVITL